MPPDVSVFIVSYNTRRLLAECLRSLEETKGDLDLEVFVADNNSTDATREMVREKFPKTHIKNYSRNMGFTRAVNPMLSLARGKYFLLLHPDIRLLPDTLNELISFFEDHPRTGILGGNLYYPDGTPNPCEIRFPDFKGEFSCFTSRLLNKFPRENQLHHEDNNRLIWSHRSSDRVTWVWNACMMVRQEVFQTVGYFDEDFFVWFADWDFCKRTSEKGWSVHYVAPAVAIHYERNSPLEAHDKEDTVRYKIDGWYSAVQQMKDRRVFWQKHLRRTSVYGVRGIYFLESFLRMWLVLCHWLLNRTRGQETAFQVKTCLKTMHAVLKG